MSDPVADTLAVYDQDPDRFVGRFDAPDAAGASAGLVGLACAGLPRGARVLDVGCGSGRDLAALRAAGLDPLGLDASAEMVRAASERGRAVLGDMRELPWEDDMFDAVLAAASLLHLPVVDGRVALTEMVRVLKPGGRLVVSVKEGDGTRVDDDGRFFQLYTASQIDDALASVGADVTFADRQQDTSRTGLWWLVRTATTSTV